MSNKGIKPLKRLLTRGEVALMFAVSPNTVSRWGREGRLPSLRTLGGQRRYRWEEVLTLAEGAGIVRGLVGARRHRERSTR